MDMYERGQREARYVLEAMLKATEKQPRPLPGFSRAATAVAEFLYTGPFAIPGDADIEPVIKQ